MKGVAKQLFAEKLSLARREPMAFIKTGGDNLGVISETEISASEILEHTTQLHSILRLVPPQISTPCILVQCSSGIPVLEFQYK